MQQVRFDINVVSKVNELPLSNNDFDLILENVGNVDVEYSFNHNSKNLTLAPSESIPFGGYEGKTLGGNKLYYGFGSGTTPLLKITRVTLGKVVDPPVQQPQHSYLQPQQNC